IDPHKSVQIGMRGSIYDKGEFALAKELGFTTIPTHKVREMGIAQTIKKAREVIGDNKVFLTFDIDFVDPAYATATGTPEVRGYTSYETIEIIRDLKGMNFVGIELVEVSPPYDSADITSLLAGNIVFEFLSVLAIDKKESEEE